MTRSTLAALHPDANEALPAGATPAVSQEADMGAVRAAVHAEMRTYALSQSEASAAIQGKRMKSLYSASLKPRIFC